MEQNKMKELQRLALERIKILLKETSDKTQGTMGELRRAGKKATETTEAAEAYDTVMNDSYAPDENGQNELYEAEKWVNALLQCVKD